MNFIYDLIARLMPTKSVDSIVAVLNKVTTRLAAAEAAQVAKARSLSEQAAQLTAQAAVAQAEADRASRARTNIAGLVA